MSDCPLFLHASKIHSNGGWLSDHFDGVV